MSENVISVEHFYKSFGATEAVTDLSFEVKKGEIFAFLGTNGAGKTTTIRALLGLIEQDRGVLLINGKRYKRDKENLVGYLPEERGLFVKEKVMDTLVFLGKLKGMKNFEAKKWASKYLEKVELSDKAEVEIKKLSSGQQQKIQLGITLIGDPKIIIMDEPTKGLDQLNRELFFQMIEELRSRGTTIMLSTHYLQEADKYAKRLLILKNGKTMAYGEIAEIKKQLAGKKIVINFEGSFPYKEILFSAEVTDNKAEIIPRDDVSAQEILVFLVQSPNFKLTNFEAETIPLEEVFVKLSKE